jgi:type II secretory pathway predicted ATPase ExeA
VFVNYAAQEAAFEYLYQVYAHPHGLGLFQGPPLSGNSTILREFGELKSPDAAVAVVDGAGLNTTALLQAALRQYGYELEFSSVNELLSMLRVFVLQQTASGEPPLLIIENTHELNPSALRVLCELASLRVRQKYALRLVLASNHAISAIVEAPAMVDIQKRLTGNFSLAPMRSDETVHYLHAKLQAGGCANPKKILPVSVCKELHSASGGWPGIVDRLAILALAKADKLPIRSRLVERPVLPNFVEIDAEHAEPASKTSDDVARLILTLNGETLREFSLERPRLLIGRAEHNDLCINSTFISRHHVMFVKFGSATLLMDLNSTNGTFVNSRRVSNQILMHGDIVSIGNHRLKFVHSAATNRSLPEGAGIEDTIIMKDLTSLRKMLATEFTEMLPIPIDLDAAAGDKPQ